ncbi:hypothetical protein DRW41_02530 [Neobacillus piezotolerans]|uniref:Uncharacterized protein n=1 Tax=Neobacillus piezotolerans TaxID=2259171 RepID=A0A3D8GW80_9BACI|nr:hypothetical protein [Neobacillus piezotolerans]RDU38459.1 hypothetical protein DRW41_02530 [Neobacillus piezotolerans]
MDLDIIWDIFMVKASEIRGVANIEMRKIAGIPFLFITVDKNGTLDAIEAGIRVCSAEAMKGKRLSSETVFVRRGGNYYVFRHRFFVPQRKMFCCGNLCVDCVRFQHDRF